MWFRTAKKHTTVMVGLFVPSNTAKQLVLDDSDVPDGCTPEEASNLHLTLCMLGEASDLNDKRDLIEAAISTAARNQAPLSGEISGVGLFTAGPKHVLYASYDAPGLVELRQAVMDGLAAVGVDIDGTHGFTPHITLAFMPDASDPRVADKGGMKLSFDTLTLAWSDKHTKFELLG